MKFSLLVPTRERPDLLSMFCISVDEMTYDKSQIEVLLAYDDDDEITQKTIDTMHYDWIKPLKRKQGKSMSVDYQNWMYKFSKGEFIFILNDDCQIKTEHWDKIAYERFLDFFKNKNAVDRVIYGRTSDPGKWSRLPVLPFSFFPIVSREAVEILGYVMHPMCGGWGTDVHLWQVYNGVDRIVDMNDIHIDHIGGCNIKDNANMSMINWSKYLGPMPDLIDDWKKLNYYIKTGKNPVDAN